MVENNNNAAQYSRCTVFRTVRLALDLAAAHPRELKKASYSGKGYKKTRRHKGREAERDFVFRGCFGFEEAFGALEAQ